MAALLQSERSNEEHAPAHRYSRPDFTWIGAGSFTTKLLADFGADVIKVESRAAWTPAAHQPPVPDARRA